MNVRSGYLVFRNRNGQEYHRRHVKSTNPIDTHPHHCDAFLSCFIREIKRELGVRNFMDQKVKKSDKISCILELVSASKDGVVHFPAIPVILTKII